MTREQHAMRIAVVDAERAAEAAMDEVQAAVSEVESRILKLREAMNGWLSRPSASEADIPGDERLRRAFAAYDASVAVDLAANAVGDAMSGYAKARAKLGDAESALLRLRVQR